MRAALIAFALGVFALQRQPTLPTPGWLAAAGLAVALGAVIAWMWRGTPALARVAAVFAMALGGFVWAAGFAHLRLAESLPAAWEGRDVEVIGVVAGLPARGGGGSLAHIRFVFTVERVLTAGARVPARVQLSHYGHGALPDYRPGGRWRLTARLKRPHGVVNPHGFDYEVWLLERRVRATGYVRARPAPARLDEFVVRPGTLVERVRERIRARIEAALAGRPYAGVLVALAVGEQGAIPPAQWEVFTRTGVNHLMSISGLHVTMLAGLAYALVAGLWRRSARLTLRLPARKAGVVAGVLAAAVYSSIAGFAVPAQRTFYMLVVAAWALWRGEFASPSRVLALALFVVLLLDPWAVLAPGFWLSFGATAVLVYAGAHRLHRPHALLLWARAQGAVTLALVPVLLLWFQQLPLVSPLANAVAIPLVSLAVVPLTLLGAILPWDGLLHLAHGLMTFGMRGLEWAAGFAPWRQPLPGLIDIALALVGVSLLLLPRGFPARWLGLILLLPALTRPAPAPPTGGLWVEVLDVGQGLAVLVRTRAHALLYDAGPGVGDAGARVVPSVLRAFGVQHLDAFVVSHDDADHAGGAGAVLAEARVTRLISSLPAAHPLRGRAARDVDCVAGQSWIWDGVRFEMLHPLAGALANPAVRDNAKSCVLKVSSPGGSVLLTGDIERRVEEELFLRSGDGLRADVLLAPHHGSNASSTLAFLEAVRPAVVVVSSGYLNRFRHPGAKALARYRALDARLLRTDRDGAVSVRTAPGRLPLIRTERRQTPRYWRE